jgi:hypothetical protein
MKSYKNIFLLNAVQKSKTFLVQITLFFHYISYYLSQWQIPVICTTMFFFIFEQRLFSSVTFSSVEI